MASGKQKRNKKAQLLTTVILFVVGILSTIFGGDFLLDNFFDSKGQADGLLKIYYLDVGQGDSAYIKVNDFDILIDAGPRSDTESLMEQLEALNIDDFEMAIATHPHEDHIGGMEAVFERYDVKEFYMPKVTNTTRVFENMIKAVASEGIKVKTIKEGMNFDLGSGAYIEVYSPIAESYEEFNDYSPIMKLTFGENSFMFTGDAEANVEKEVVKKYSTELRADVLKFGHHGSSTSSTEEFIQAVNPNYGIISCGANNKYGHPHREILSIIDEYEIETYRTDVDGQITLSSDGKTIIIEN